MRSCRSNWLPFGCAIAGYVLLALLYGARALAGNLLLAEGDGVSYYYPHRLYYALAVQHGFPLWLPHEFLGVPLIGLHQTGVLYPLNAIYFLLAPPLAYNASLLLHQVLAGLFTFLYVRRLGVRPWPAFLAGTVFAFSGFLVAHQGHLAMQHAAAWLPCLLYLYERIRAELSLRPALLAALVVAVQVFAGHPQMCVYTYLVLGLFAVFYLLRTRPGSRARFAALAAAPVVLGALIALPQLVATAELAAHASRPLEMNYHFFTGYSLHPLMAAGLAVPRFPWWNCETCGFVGLVPVVLAILAWVWSRKQNAHVRFWGMVCAVALLLALGKYNPLYRIMYYVPGYRLFRCPARNLFELGFAVAVLFALGLDLLMASTDGRALWRSVARGAVAAGGIVAIAFAAGLVVWRHESFWSPAAALRDVGEALLFAVGALACLYWLVKSRGARALSMAALAALVFGQGCLFGHTTLSDWPTLARLRELQHNRVLDFLKSHAGADRVAYVTQETFPLFNLPAGVNALNGYDPLAPADVWLLVGMAPQGTCTDWAGLLARNTMLSALNVRHIVVPDGFPVSPEAMVSAATTPSTPPARAVSSPAWRLSSAREVEGGYALESPDGGHTESALEQELTVKRATRYRFSLEARAESPTRSLHLTIGATTRSERPELRFSVPRDELGGAFRRLEWLFSSSTLSGPVRASVSAKSRRPIVVRNVIIEELPALRPPFLGALAPGESRAHGVPLYRLVFAEGGQRIFENRNALPKLYAVTELRPAATPRDVARAFESMEANPATTALVAPADLEAIGRREFCPAQVSLDAYQPDEVRASVRLEGVGFLVLAEQYYPGWRAFVDGHPAPIYRVNGALRGIVVPPGQHRITFRYVPRTFYASVAVAAVALVVCLAGLATLAVRRKLSTRVACAASPTPAPSRTA